MQERLRDWGRGTHPNTPADPPSKPKLPRCLLGLRPPLTKWVPKPIHRRRARRQGKNRPYSILPTVQRQAFSHLLTSLPMPMPAPALDTVSTTRPAHLSNSPFRNYQHSYPTGTKGLACPYGSPKCQEEKAQLKARVRQVAAVAGGSTS